MNWYTEIGCENIDGGLILATEIVMQAVNDWLFLSKGKKCGAKNNVNFIEIKKFLLSDWCEFLLSTTEITGQHILQQLENRKIEIENETNQKMKIKICKTKKLPKRI